MIFPSIYNVMKCESIIFIFENFYTIYSNLKSSILPLKRNESESLGLFEVVIISLKSLLKDSYKKRYHREKKIMILADTLFRP
jgi:hypothetical protein